MVSIKIRKTRTVWFLVLALLLATISSMAVSNYSSFLGSSSKLTESLQDDTYSATLKFNIIGIRKEEAVKVLMLNTDDFAITMKLQIINNHYIGAVSEKFTKQEIDNYNENVRPQFLVIWKDGNKNKVESIRRFN